MKRIKFLTTLLCSVLLIGVAQATDVCGDISGVWDLAGSPYIVNCDVTVPAGETLEIDPGVQVLFTGHYKFIVIGNLQAIGTEQDSILFTRAFPTEESKWWGVRFADVTSDFCKLKYCILEYGWASGGSGPDGHGGAINCVACNLTVENCTIRSNRATNSGGIHLEGTGSPSLIGCRIEYNLADQDGGGLSLDGDGGLPILTRCVVAHNTAGWRAAGIYLSRSNPTLTNCTVTENDAGWSGGAIWTFHSVGYSAVLVNCILWGNSAPVDHEISFGEIAGDILATYSDISGGYQGDGNIDLNPLLVNAGDGDFHLQEGSPCIDTGDPTSPLDPDITIADMGAYYFDSDAEGDLPVELLSFQAYGTDEGIKIAFQTASETNNDHFEIYRGNAPDGQFDMIASIESTGNSSTGHQYEYLDESIAQGLTYWYYLVDVDLAGGRSEHRNLMVSAIWESEIVLPSEYSISAHPNPFNPSTSLQINLVSDGHVAVSIYDISGRIVARVLDSWQPAGELKIAFDGGDLSAGVYFASLNANGATKVAKLVLLK